MKSNDEFIVGRKYKTSHGTEGLCVGFTLEGPPILQFSGPSVRIVTDINCWEEVRKPIEAWAVVEYDTDEIDSVSTSHEEAEELLSELDPDLHRIVHLREVI